LEFVVSVSSLPEYLSTQQLADQLGITRDALEQLRRRGGGPPFIRISPREIRYRRADVDAFFAARVEQPGREVS
jgi:predicted DNA-binding transcriptional regulator AlpA